MTASALIRFVRLLCADRRFGVVLQKEIRPIRRQELLSFPDDIEDPIVPGLTAFAQLALDRYSPRDLEPQGFEVSIDEGGAVVTGFPPLALIR